MFVLSQLVPLISFTKRIMRKFNPVEFNRDMWGDQSRTKNHPPQCQQHKYCHTNYEWQTAGEEHNHLHAMVTRQEATALIRLPTNADPSPIITYDMMTEQNLDDWYAQSINRTLPSMLNPQKKFYLPPNFDEDIRSRNPAKTKGKQFEEETYFPKRKDLSEREKEEIKKNPVKALFVQPQQLQPKVLAGTPIRNREPQQAQKTEVRRRNAVLLVNDIHYARFLKKMARSKQKTEEVAVVSEGREVPANRSSMIYSFNMESMKRNTSDQDVPNSIIKREFERIRQPQRDFITANRNTMKKQEEIQENIRLKINDKANEALNRIDGLAHHPDNNPFPRRISENIRRRTSTVGTRGGKAVTNPGPSIESKVMRLLNSMQVVSQHIDVEMANLNIHLSETMLQHFSDSIQHKWVRKAEEKIREKEHLLAIDCYKQALILQPDSFIPIFNIAVLLEKETMLTYAKEWFTLAKDKDTEIEKVTFGLALVLVKQLNFPAALKEIDELIQRLEKVDPHRRKIDMTYYYLRALCYKKLEMFDKARIDYEMIIKVSKPSNYYSLSYFLLSVVFAKSRRYKQKFNCLSYMNWRETLYLLFYEKSKRIKQDSMSSVEFVDKLTKQPFFSRFSKNLLKKLLDNSNYETVKKDTIIFACEEESLLIVNGLVSVWSHQKSITNPDTVIVLGQGGVIGAGDIDNHLSSRPNYWFLAKTDIEMLRISRADFRLFWQGQVTFEWDYKYNFLRNVGLFKGLPESTLFLLCEHIQLNDYKQGEILFNDCSYRNQLMSKQGLGFCLGKARVDPRFVNVKKVGKPDDPFKRHRTRSRLCNLLKKHTFKFNEMKFNRLKFKGLFILVQGKVEIEDDRGFRCKDIVSPRDYFGENLLIHSDGFHNYGRMVVDSPSARFYLLTIQKMLWMFTSLDKELMTTNALNRKQIETVRFLRNRFNECLQVKMAKLLAKRD